VPSAVAAGLGIRSILRIARAFGLAGARIGLLALGIGAVRPGFATAFVRALARGLDLAIRRGLLRNFRVAAIVAAVLGLGRVLDLLQELLRDVLDRRIVAAFGKFLEFLGGLVAAFLIVALETVRLLEHLLGGFELGRILGKLLQGVFQAR